MKIFILLAMIFLHIVDDYYLQGGNSILWQFKQKDFWDKEFSGDAKAREHHLYRHDYKVALLTHAFSWTFVVHIPIIAWMLYQGYYNQPGPMMVFGLLFVVMWIVHAITDNEKANRKIISLKTDQLIHLLQIMFIWATWMFLIIGRE